jgi:hypothetical protein
MTAPGQGQFGHQGQPSSQQIQGQLRQGQGQQMNHNGQQQKGLQAGPDPKLAQFTFRKPSTSHNKTSWLDVEPLQLCVPLAEVQLELDRMTTEMREKSRTIQSRQRELPDNAATKYSEFLKKENIDLQKMNPRLEWVTAGIELNWKVIRNAITADHKILRRFDIILKTQPRPGVQNITAKATGQSGNQGNKAQGQNNMVNQNALGGGGPPPPPPPPPPPQNIMNGGPQHSHLNMAPGPPPPPPPPHGGGGGGGGGAPGGMQHSQHHFNVGLAHQQVPESGRLPSMRHESRRLSGIEVMDPNILRHQKSKSNLVPGRYPDESDSESSTDETESISAISAIDEPGYGVVSGRGRRQGNTRDKLRDHDRRRDISRGNFEQQKEKYSRRLSRSGIERPAIGRRSSSSHKRSPRESQESVKVAPVQIHLHTGSADSNKKSERDEDRDRQLKYRAERQHDPRRSIHDIPTHHTPRGSGSLHKSDKFPANVPMSRQPSTANGSESLYSEEDSSVTDYEDESTFDRPVAPMPPSVGPGGARYEQGDHHFVQIRNTHRQRPSINQSAYSDYPHEPHQRARADSHHQDQRMDIGDQVEKHYHNGLLTKIVTTSNPMSRRHSVQVQHIHHQLPIQPSRAMSYAEPASEPYYAPAPKSLTNTNTKYLEDGGLQQPVDVQALAETVEAMQRHIRESQRPPPLRRNSTRVRPRHGSEIWPNRDYTPDDYPSQHRGGRGSIFGNAEYVSPDYEEWGH